MPARPDVLQPIQIQPGPLASALTEQQARFNALVRDVALWRAALAQWTDRTHRFDQVVEPIRRELHGAWRQWVFALDAASLQPGLSRAERAQLHDLLHETATELLAVEADDGEIAALLRRHEAEAVAPAGSSDADLAREDDSEPSVQDWEALAQAAAAQRQQRAARRRAAKVQQRGAEAAQQVSQSLRDVFRKLASALHPDREPDAQQRARKTRLMQQANQAYADGNLLALLELQIEAEQVDAAQQAAQDERRLQHYITVLQDQLAELQSEVRRLEAWFRAATGLAPGTGLQPAKADRLITAQAKRLRGDLACLRGQGKVLLDLEATRLWLREQRRAG